MILGLQQKYKSWSKEVIKLKKCTKSWIFQVFRICFINPLTFIIFFLTDDFLKFIFVRNIFIDLVVIRGSIWGFSISGWSVTGLGENVVQSEMYVSQEQSEVFRFVQMSILLGQTKFFFYISGLTSHVNSISFFLEIFIFNLSLNFFTSWSNLRQLSSLHLFLASIRFH